MRPTFKLRAKRLPVASPLATLRDRALFLWHAHWQFRDKGGLLFFAALPLPFVLLGALVVFAHRDYGRIEANRERRTELTCLAENVYYEARGEPLAGQYAVAEVTMNRVASPLFPATVCGVVHEQRWDPIRKRYVGAFSWTELDSNRLPRGAAWRQALTVAEAVYDGEHPETVKGALFYHAKNMKPRWAKGKRPVATIGRHVFYK
ncbi:MAG TPA: cell wall hydrolase [Gammaproteobacteria bacterium]|nr:cell wall hydrolase [Gammaproteobacteria bacterium]